MTFHFSYTHQISKTAADTLLFITAEVSLCKTSSNTTRFQENNFSFMTLQLEF